MQEQQPAVPEEKAQEVPAKAEEKTIEVPPYCVFKMGEIVPMKGWVFRCLGYTKNFEVVFGCVGMTGATRKKMTEKAGGK